MCQVPLILEHLAEVEDLHTCIPKSQQSNESPAETSPEVEELDRLLAEESNQEEQCYDDVHIERALCMIRPSGVLKKRCHAQVYTKLFKMAWNGKDSEAVTFVK